MLNIIILSITIVTPLAVVNVLGCDYRSILLRGVSNHGPYLVGSREVQQHGEAVTYITGHHGFPSWGVVVGTVCINHGGISRIERHGLRRSCMPSSRTEE